VDDQIIIDAIPLRAVAGAPGVDQFQIGATAVVTAENIATALNAPANSFEGIVYARAAEGVVYLTAITVGSAGNAITLSIVVATPGTMVVSGATLTGGDERPSKPATAQDKLFRHGNVLSPENTWLDDELVDPTLRLESTQRVQLQYRIRVFGQGQGLGSSVALDVYPDGLDDPNILGQGTEGTPVAGFPFTNMRRELGDPGLWRAGDGDVNNLLGTVDGYTYAIPICAIFRKNSGSFVAVTSAGTPNQNGAFSRNPSANFLSFPPDGATILNTATLTNDILYTDTGIVQITNLQGSGLDDPKLNNGAGVDAANPLYVRIGEEVLRITNVDTSVYCKLIMGL